MSFAVASNRPGPTRRMCQSPDYGRVGAHMDVLLEVHAVGALGAADAIGGDDGGRFAGAVLEHAPGCNVAGEEDDRVEHGSGGKGGERQRVGAAGERADQAECKQ